MAKTDDQKDIADLIPPLIYKVGPRRPNKLRRESDEETIPTKLRRENTKNKCTRCLQYGHNTRTCKERPVATSGFEAQVVGFEIPTIGNTVKLMDLRH